MVRIGVLGAGHLGKIHLKLLKEIPDFEFVTGMVAAQIYYISAVVGNKGVNGLPDIGDPCLSISNATPIVFYSLPVAMTIGSALLGCDPQSVILDIGQSETGVAIRYFWSALASYSQIENK